MQPNPKNPSLSLTKPRQSSRNLKLNRRRQQLNLWKISRPKTSPIRLANLSKRKLLPHSQLSRKFQNPSANSPPLPTHSQLSRHLRRKATDLSLLPKLPANPNRSHPPRMTRPPRRLNLRYEQAFPKSPKASPAIVWNYLADRLRRHSHSGRTYPGDRLRRQNPAYCWITPSFRGHFYWR